MTKRIFIFIIGSLMMSCKSISVANETQTITTQSIELGRIGEDKTFLLEVDYNSTAIPIYSEPIRLKVDVLEFNKTSYKAFANANSVAQTPLTISNEDSLSVKPKYLKLEIADRVAVLKALNDKENTGVKTYISNKKAAHIISAVSIALKPNKMEAIRDADALYLEQKEDKTYMLKAYKNDQLHASITFNEVVVFAYQDSNFCWQEDDQYQLHIVDIVESTDKCPNRTYRNAKRAEKKINYFKF